MDAGKPYLTRVAMVCLLVVFPIASAWWAAEPLAPLRGVVLAVALGCLTAATRGRASLPTALLVSVTAFLGTFVAASLQSATPWLSLTGRMPRHEGLPWLVACVVVVAFAGRLAGPASPSVRCLIDRCMAVTMTLVAAAALVESVAYPGYRLATLFGNVSDAAAFALLVMGFFLWGGSGWPRWVGLVSATVLIGVSGSRAAMILLVGLSLAAAGWACVRRRSLRAGWPALVAVTGAVVGLITPLARSRILGSSPMSGATIRGRLLLWEDAVSLWMARPWLGTGPSRFVDDINAHHSTAWAAEQGGGLPPDSAHNILLQLLSATGLAGCLAALAVVAVVAWLWWCNREDPWVPRALWAGLAVAAMTLAHPTTSSFLVPLMVVVGAALPVSDPGAKRGRVTAVAVGGLALLVGIWGVWMVMSETRLAVALEQGVRREAGAIESIAAAGRSMPGNPDLARRAGYAIVRLGQRHDADASKAVELMEDACQRLPRSVECALALADAYNLTGRTESERDLLLDAAVWAPVDTGIIMRLGVASAELGDVDGAERYFRQAADLLPDAAEPWQNLAYLYELQGRQEEADAAAREAQRRR